MIYVFVRDGCSKATAVLDILRYVYGNQLIVSKTIVPNDPHRDVHYQDFINTLTTFGEHLILIGLPMETRTLAKVCEGNAYVEYLCDSSSCSDAFWRQPLDANNLSSIVRRDSEWYASVWYQHLTDEDYQPFIQWLSQDTRQGVLF